MRKPHPPQRRRSPKPAARLREPSRARKAQALKGSDFLSLADIDRAQFLAILATAAKVKADIRPFRQALSGMAAVLLFEKPSLRTRLTFEVGFRALGGDVVMMDHSANPLGERESVKDYARTIERCVDCVVARVFKQSVLEEMAGVVGIPIVNALSELHHPCQGLADLLTLREHCGDFSSLKFAYIGDGNNVCHSLMHGAALAGAKLVVITPPGNAPLARIVEESRRIAKNSNAEIELTEDPAKVAGCKAVYTDVWISMGQGAGRADEAGKRRKLFMPYQVTPELMARAGSDAKFLHCLPAHRGEEVLDAVMDSPNSIVYDQAENRLHVQNALMVHILGQG